VNERTDSTIVSIILTGGEASRMRPLSNDQSKSMLPFLGRPLLAYLLDDLARAGLSCAVMTSQGKNNDIERHFGDGASRGLRLSYLRASGWKGTAGTIMSLLDHSPIPVSSPFLVIYGDSLLQIDYRALLELHRNAGAVFTVACHRPRFEDFVFESEASSRPRTNFGVVDLLPDGRVRRFEEKPYLDEIGSHFHNPVANAAVYVVEPSALNDLPLSSPRGLDFGYDVIPLLVARGDCVCGIDIAPGFRIDLGTLSHYLSVQLASLRGQVPIQPGFQSLSEGIWIEDGAKLDAGASIVPPALVCRDAVVENGATLSSAIVGARAIVREKSLVFESVVLDNVTIGAGARVEGSVLGPHTSVQPGATLPRGTITGAWSRLGGSEFLLSEAAVRGLLGTR
jgi:NDP-sugar pyrophosphorylase family protein